METQQISQTELPQSHLSGAKLAKTRNPRQRLLAFDPRGAPTLTGPAASACVGGRRESGRRHGPRSGLHGPFTAARATPERQPHPPICPTADKQPKVRTSLGADGGNLLVPVERLRPGVAIFVRSCQSSPSTGFRRASEAGSAWSLSACGGGLTPQHLHPFKPVPPCLRQRSLSSASAHTCLDTPETAASLGGPI